MRVAVYSTKSYDEQFLLAASAGAGHDLRFLEPRLTVDTARLAADARAICAFVNDTGADQRPWSLGGERRRV